MEGDHRLSRHCGTQIPDALHGMTMKQSQRTFPPYPAKLSKSLNCSKIFLEGISKNDVNNRAPYEDQKKSKVRLYSN